ncbi:MAG: DUF1553 domain-containing protein [Planctomycetales bacterium]|nr:DUF1553 domain-containing protein [Planctomycetales bacterium]
MLRYRSFWSLFVVAVLVRGAQAAPPLHEQIDRLIESHPAFEHSAAELADDATFLRRAFLDLSGVIPSAAQVRSFLADPAAEKRVGLVDALLNSPQYARRMQYVFDEMLMERRSGKHIPTEEWHAYLHQSFLENRPWDELVREVLSADGSDLPTRPAAKFLLDRELQADLVTRDLGRIFLGRDLQCAQCHDHPTVDDYLQRHYFGLSAFVTRSYMFKDAETGVYSIGEKAEGDVEFTSVFTGETSRTAPRLLDLPPRADPPAEEEPYLVKRAKNVRAVPVYSRRLQLAIAMTDVANVAFRRNIANRLWAMMMGRGLVEPLDMMHEGNPPTHPQLLDLLSDALLEHDFDVRYLLRELALTRAYQRSSDRPTEPTDGEQVYAVGLLKPLSPEQLAWSMMRATGAVGEQVPECGAARAELDLTTQTAVEAFVQVFGAAGQSTGYDAAAEQALFLRNGTLLQSWLAIDEGLVANLSTLCEERVPEELYLSVFSRQPSDEEAQRVLDFLTSQEDRRTALQQLVWASLVSTEFRFNH